MRLWRVFPWEPNATDRERGHPLWIPRERQGAGRHDNPQLYGAMYVSESNVAAVAEAIAHLRGQRLEDTDLERNGLRLALVELEAGIEGRLHDLDDPRVLSDCRLRPSQVATRHRQTTHAWAATLFRRRPQRDGLRWWSTLESSWIHVTLFDRAMRRVRADTPQRLRLDHPVVASAAEAVGVRL
jgi:RES domain